MFFIKKKQENEIPDVWFVEIENNYTKVSFVKLKSKIKGENKHD